MESNAVTWALLGLLSQRPHSGYDLKRTVDMSIRHFWAASYGQIYPELRRLETAGWIEGASAAAGGRPRREYRITDAGRHALSTGCTASRRGSSCATSRCCASSSPTRCRSSRRSGWCGRGRDGYAAMREYFVSLDDGSGVPDPAFVDLVYRWGLDYCAWGEAWCREHRAPAPRGS